MLFTSLGRCNIFSFFCVVEKVVILEKTKRIDLKTSLFLFSLSFYGVYIHKTTRN